MNNTITLKLKSIQEEQLFNTFSEFQTTPPQYAKWQLKPENCVITCYISGKTVFQGKDANVYACLLYTSFNTSARFMPWMIRPGIEPR